MGVEWLRSCYISKWRLFRNSDVLTKGRYYFCDPATPMYTGWHNFGSSTWYDRNNGLGQGLGELINYRRVWVDGEPPTVVPAAISLGDADCIANGEDINEAIPAEDLIDGFPPLCYVTPDEDVDRWHEASSFMNCRLQRFYARIIEWLYDEEWGMIRQAFTDLLGDSVTIVFTPHAANFPALVTVKGNNFFVAVMDGTKHFQELALQGFFSVQKPTDYGVLGTNPQWYAASAYIMGKMIEQGLAPNMRVFLSGHSYGAAVACILAARLTAWAAMTKIVYLTFGCPKPGDQRLRTFLDQIEGVNLANLDDLVTVFPPDRDTLLPVMQAMALPELAVWLEWIRPGNQVGMDSDGVIQQNEFPLLDFTTLRLIVLKILAFQQLNPITGHKIEEYFRRLSLRCDGPLWPVDKKLSDWLDSGAGNVVHEDIANVPFSSAEMVHESQLWRSLGFHVHGDANPLKWAVIHEGANAFDFLSMVHEGKWPFGELIHEYGGGGAAVPIIGSEDCSAATLVEVDTLYTMPVTASGFYLLRLNGLTIGNTYQMTFYGDAGGGWFGLANADPDMCSIPDWSGLRWPTTGTDTKFCDPAFSSGMGAAILADIGMTQVWFRFHKL